MYQTKNLLISIIEISKQIRITEIGKKILRDIYFGICDIAKKINKSL